MADAFDIFWNATLEAFFYGALPIMALVFSFYIVLRFFCQMSRDRLFILLMFVAFGTFLGIFITTSRDPIVGSILPLIITFVSGYIAYSFKKEDGLLNSDIIPGAIICLVFSATFGAFFGSELRQTAERSAAEAQFTFDQKKEDNSLKRERSRKILEEVEIPLSRLAGCWGKYGDACRDMLK